MGIRTLVARMAAIILLVAPLLVAPRHAGAVVRPVVYYGMTGNSVQLVQWKLNQWGYYRAVVDGIFGDETLRAVREFQSRNGLGVDGVVGPEVWAAIGLPTEQAGGSADAGGGGSPNTRGDEMNMLSRAVHGEAVGEPYKGKVAVAAVILNRTRSALYPHSVAEVIYQPFAFESVDSGTFYENPTDEDTRAAQDALNGWDPTNGAIYFWNPAKVEAGNYVWTRPITLQIGQHVFAT